MPSDIWDKTVGTLIFLAAFAIGLHGLVTQTGLAGWIVLAQHQLFGWSSTKLTMLLSMVVLGFAGLTLWAGFQKLRGRRDAGAQAMRVLAGTPAGARELTRRELAGWLAAGIALTWAIGAGAWWWTVQGEQRDASAHYEPLALEAGRAPQPAGSHLLLKGLPLTSHVVVHTTRRHGSTQEDHQLVPIVPPGWQEGMPVSFVARVGARTDLGWRPWDSRRMRPGRRDEPFDMHVRLDGAVPPAAGVEFRKMNVPLAEPAWQLDVISTTGAVAIRDRRAEYLQTMLIVCAIVSGALVVSGLAVMAGWAIRRRRLGY